MRFEFTGDELILVLVSLVRSVNPAMLKTTPDGFTFDFELLEQQQGVSPLETLLHKVRTALEGAEPSTGSSLELSAAERRQLASVLQRLESSQPWPADALKLTRGLQTRLLAGL